MMYKKQLFIFSFVLCFFVMHFSCNTQQNNSATHKRGLAVYQKYCFACHGADGKLNLNKATDLTTSTLPKAKVIQQIKKGKGMMQAYEKMLLPEEIAAVTNYIIEMRKKK